MAILDLTGPRVDRRTATQLAGRIRFAGFESLLESMSGHEETRGVPNRRPWGHCRGKRLRVRAVVQRYRSGVHR